MIKNLYLLFIKFFKIGAFTFGGGYAMISLIHTETVDKMKWLTDEEMNNMIVVAESTPGVLAVNTATFVGYKTAGIFGAAAATFGVILPSLIIIGVISLFFDAFRELRFAAYAFEGLRAGVVLLIFDAVLKLSRKNKKDAFYYCVLLLTAALSVIFGINPIFLLMGATVAGILYSIKSWRTSKTGGDKSGERERDDKK